MPWNQNSNPVPPLLWASDDHLWPQFVPLPTCLGVIKVRGEKCPAGSHPEIVISLTSTQQVHPLGALESLLPFTSLLNLVSTHQAQGGGAHTCPGLKITSTWHPPKCLPGSHQEDPGGPKVPSKGHSCSFCHQQTALSKENEKIGTIRGRLFPS